MSIAVIRTGGKQYVVKGGDTITVEKLEGEPNATVQFPVLLVADEQGTTVQIGNPTLPQTVSAKVTRQFRDEKIDVVKFKSKVRYRRRVGHRQPYTTVRIEKI